FDWGPPTGAGSGFSRRELLRVGGLNALGLSLPGLLHLQARGDLVAREPLDLSFGRAKTVIFLWLRGGPPQHARFDPTPGAPAEHDDAGVHLGLAPRRDAAQRQRAAGGADGRVPGQAVGPRAPGLRSRRPPVPDRGTGAARRRPPLAALGAADAAGAGRGAL